MQVEPSPNAVDVVLAVDTTGAMGTYVTSLRRHLLVALKALERKVPDVRVGVVAFKDHGPEGEDACYLTRTLAPTSSREALLEFLCSPALALGRGGGGAEAVECALRAARGLAWRLEAHRAIVLVGDKPPHGAGLDALAACPHGVDWRDEVEALADDGVVVHAVAVGQDLCARRVFEYCAARTGGACVTLRHARDVSSAVAAACLEGLASTV